MRIAVGARLPRPSALGYGYRSLAGGSAQHPLVALLRRWMHRPVDGYEDANDAGRLAQEPIMRVIGGRRPPRGKQQTPTP